MIKWLVAIALAAGVVAGMVAAGLGDDPDSIEALLRKSDWQSQRTQAILAGRPEPEPNWDNRPWVARNAPLFGAAVGGGVFVIGLLVIIAAGAQPAKPVRTGDTADDDPDADLFEDFDDPYADPDPAPRQPAVRVNPKRKARA